MEVFYHRTYAVEKELVSFLSEECLIFYSSSIILYIMNAKFFLNFCLVLS
jgi:hypothetical protein